MRKNILYISALAIAFAACSENIENTEQEKEPVTFDASTALKSEITPFHEEGDVPATRVNMGGNTFETGDLIRLRIIAPYSNSSEFGEYTDAASYDNWWLLTWAGNNKNWAQIPDTLFDLNCDFKTNSISANWLLTQNTPYVFTATTWTEEIHFVTNDGDTSTGANSTVHISFSNVFKADQRDEKNYKASDVLWAQQFMQTATESAYLSFQHKMSALNISLKGFTGLLSEGDITLTLENMPDIDQQEVVIGNYYAAKIKSKRNYGESTRSACEYDENGKVLGIAVIDETVNKKIIKKAFTDLPQTGAYIAHPNSDGTFCLIVPPYTVPIGTTPTLWLRQGNKRWSAPLTLPENRTFVSGTRYNVKMVAPEPGEGGE